MYTPQYGNAHIIYVRVKIIYVYTHREHLLCYVIIYVRVKIIYAYIQTLVIISNVWICVRAEIIYTYTTFCLSSCISAASSKSYHQ